MIIDELCKYYDLSTNVKIGFKLQEIGFIIVIDKSGNLISIDDLREKSGKKYQGKLYEVPSDTKRTGNIKANILYDTLEYCVGIKNQSSTEKKDNSEKKKEDFINSVKDLNAICNDASLGYLIKFLENDPKSQFEKYIQNSSQFKSLDDFFGKSYSWITFRIDGNPTPIIVDLLQNINYTNHFKDKIVNSIAKDNKEYEFLIDGVKKHSCKNHFPIKVGKFTSPFCSLNQDSFYSYNKENPPVDQETVYKYCTALSNLLSLDKNKVSFNDYTIVFWSDVSSCEEPFAKLFNITPSPDEVIEVKELFESIYNSQASVSDTNKYFYILGFKPGYRFSIKFWHKLNIFDLSKNIVQHFNDLFIESNFKINYSLINCLNSLFRKEENKPPKLFEEMTEAIYSGTLYPSSFLSYLRRRHELEKITEDQSNYEIIKRSTVRTALIKAYVNRRNRIYNQNIKELTMGLDKDNLDVGYCIGRLLSTLVKAQNAAGYNSYIKSYKNILNNPSSLSIIIGDYYNVYEGKIKNQGSKVFYRKLIGEIFNNIKAIPVSLTEDQKLYFIVGFEHQTNEFFKKNEE